MFKEMFVLIDDLARPILVIPEDLPSGDAFLNIVEGGVDIGVGKKVLGRIRDMDDTSLALLGLQEKVGMATYKGTKKQEMPDKIQYVAAVSDLRST